MKLSKKGDKFITIKETGNYYKGQTGIIDEDNSYYPYIIWDLNQNIKKPINCVVAFKDMKTANLSLETAKELYKQGGASKLFALDNYSENELNKKALPKNINEVYTKSKGYYYNDQINLVEVDNIELYSESFPNLWKTKELAEASVALSKLIYLRDIYNDGWVANWMDSSTKFIILNKHNNIGVDFWNNTMFILNFKTYQVRDEFLTNFRDLIEIAKPLI